MEKKETKNKLIDISYPVFHLNFSANQIINSFSAIERLKETDFAKTDQEKFNIIQTNIFSLILIRINSFIEEYDKNFNSNIPVLKDKISGFKKTVKPAISRIKKYKDINEFRNIFLAHSYRVQKENHKSVFQNEKIKDYNIPNTFNEFYILVGSVIIINQIIVNLFSEELSVFKDKVKSNIVLKTPKDSSLESAFIELNKIENEVAKIIQIITT